MGRREGRGGRAWAAGLLAAALAACADTAVDVGALEARHPALAEHRGHRLGDTRPYYLPAAGRVRLFLCRWPDGATIPVKIGGESVLPSQRDEIRAVLAAWEGAGLGLRFQEERHLAGVGIEIELRDAMVAVTANTVTDCAVAPESARRGDDPLEARVVFASVHVSRDDPRLAGTVLHEIGHALGFQGHARRNSVMVADSRAVRRIGEQVRRGETLEAPALAALYAVPSGTVVRTLPSDASATRDVDRLLALGLERDWIGPLVRVGDREGRLAWRDGSGRRVATLVLEGLADALRTPGALAIRPRRGTASLLERAR